MSILEKLNSPMLYAICGGIIAFVALVCVVFLVRAYRVGIQLGMDRAKLRRMVISSATFSVLPLGIMSLLFILVPSLTGSTSFMILPSGAIAIGFAFLNYKKALKRAQEESMEQTKEEKV